MRSAISFSNKQGCGAVNLSLFHTSNFSDGFLSSRSLFEGVFAELIVEWPMIAPFMTEYEWSGILLVREGSRVAVDEGNGPKPPIFLISLIMSPCP